MSDFSKVDEAMTLIEQYGQIDGAHHKAWVLDQVARVLMRKKYKKWVKDMQGEYDEETDEYEYGYDEGIAP